MLHGSAVISLLLLVNSRSCWNSGSETEAFSEFKRILRPQKEHISFSKSRSELTLFIFHI